MLGLSLLVSLIKIVTRQLFGLFFSRVHATLQPALSVGRSVGWSVRHTLPFFIDFIYSICFYFTAPAQVVW